MSEVQQHTSQTSPFWIGDDQAEEFAQLGSTLMRAAHEARPNYPGRDAVSLELMKTNDFEAFTSFERGVSKIHFSRGWIVYAHEALIGAR